MNNNLLNYLIEILNNCEKLKVEYAVTGQEVKYQEDNKLSTYSLNTIMEVDYLKKTAKKSIIKSDFYGMTETLETYENNMKNSSDSNEKITFTDEEFKNLFEPGGELYPIYLQKLVPVESKMNNDNCQVCVPSDELTKDIPGYIKSNYTIYKKSNDLYDITTIMNQLDELSGKILMQYCNIKIYILK